MKIILIEDLETLGQSGQIIEVKDGYARNYLIPHGLAKLATPANIKIAEQIERRKLVKIEKEKEQAEEFAAKLSSISCTIPVKVGLDDKLYGTVTSANTEIDKKDILLEEPIKKIGVYKIPVRIHADVTAEVKVWVVKE